MNTFSKLGGAALAVALGITGTTLAAGPADAARPTRIKGTVTSESGTPLVGITVTTMANVSGEWVDVDDAVTGATGAYNVGRLDDGVYLVRFDDPAGTYASEFYDDAATADAATPVDLTGGGMPTLTVARLAGVAHLVGTVTGSDGAGVAGAEVTAYALQGTEWASVGTVTAGADGSYDIGGLSGGAHTLGFRDPVSGVTEYWNDKATLAEADTVTVPSADDHDVTLATPLPPAPQPQAPSVTPTPTSVTPVATTTPTASLAALAVVKQPRIKGIAEVGSRLKLVAGTWDASAVTLEVQWLANGKKIRRATTMRLKLSDKLVGKRISARIVASAPGRTPVTVATKRTARVVD